MLNTVISPIGVLILSTWGVTAQLGLESQKPITDQTVFYMDSTEECGQQFFMGKNPATVYGSGGKKDTDPPNVCEIKFITDGINIKQKFRVEVMNAKFYADGLEFNIFDGSSQGQKLVGFGSGFNKDDPVDQLETSGGFVTFQLKKQNPDNYNYDIKVLLTPMEADRTIMEECPAGEGPGCVYYYSSLTVSKEVFIGIAGAVFGLIIFIVVPIVVICCYCRSKRVTKRENELKASQSNTATNICDSIESMRATSHDTKSKLWASQSSKAGLSSVRRSPPRGRSVRYSEDEESAFDDGPPRTYPPQPPPYEPYDRNDWRNKDHFDGRRKNGRNDWNDSKNYHFDRNERRNDNYDKRNRRNYRDEEDDYDRRPRRELDRRQRDPPSRRSYHSDSNSETDTSFVQAKDDHPQETFVERIIEPRVKPKSKVKATKVVEEDVYDELSEDIEAIKDSGVQCEPSDDEDESNTETTDEGTTDSESESEDEKKVDPRAALYSKPNKKVEKSSNEPNSQPAVLPSGPASYPNNIMAGHPNFGQPLMGQPMTMMRPPTSGIIPGVVVRPVTQPQFIPGQPYGQPSVMRPGIPVQPFRPVQPSYPVGTGLPNPQPFPKSQPPQPQITSVPPQGLPMHSYLIERGYKNRYSPASSVSGTSNHSGAHVINLTDNSEMGANLQSGVDLMKRTTDV